MVKFGHKNNWSQYARVFFINGKWIHGIKDISQ